MKRYILLALTAILAFTPVLAQGKGKKNKEEMRKEIQEYKIKFIAQEIELKDNQKKQFVDIYQKMEGEKHKMFEAARKTDEKVKKNKNATEADYEEASKALDNARNKEAEIDKRYETQFKTFLSSKQIYKMKQAEDKFRQKMREMRQNKKKKKKDK